MRVYWPYTIIVYSQRLFSLLQQRSIPAHLNASSSRELCVIACEYGVRT